MKIPFTKSNGGTQSPASLVAALVLVALVPAVCVLWFMSIAMRNERLAVQERLAEVYLNHLTSLQRQVTSFWQARQAALQSSSAGLSPAEQFAAAIRGKLADAVVVYGDSGRVVHPIAVGLESRTEDGAEWALARELEFQKNNPAAAAAAYGRIAETSRELHARARAMQAQAGCLLKAGQKEAALNLLAALAADTSLHGAVSAQGTLIGPNVQLMILKLLGQTADGTSEAGRQRQTLDVLVARLNDYTGAAMPSSQRRFLMHEIATLAPEAAAFPTLAAEDLVAEYLEREPARPTESKLQRTALAKVWSLPSADRTIVALFREDRLKSELTGWLAPLALPDARMIVLPPGEKVAADKRVPSLDAGEFLPGWRLALGFRNGDPLSEASARQSRIYLWIGFFVVLIIALLALVVARFVAAQMRLARLKNELVSTVSHELKTPLASMRALVDTLAAGRFRDEQQLREYLQLIAKENLRLCHLIENFLAFSRMERGQQRFRFEDLAPAALAREAVAVLQEKLEAPHCRFELQVGTDLPRIRGDAEALATVLINLLDNACKYTGDEKRISLRAKANRRDVWFEIEDNGIGLAPEEVRRIFDRFYQVDQSLTRQRAGCGLGLSIVKFIVEAHHGTVEVASTPGRGSTFRVRIPVATPNA